MSLTHALALSAFLTAIPCLATEPGYLCDPVVTHTNGMRLASSTSTRSHNVYWQCEAGHIGYCDGLMRGPLHDDWRELGTRCCGKFAPPYTPMGPSSKRALHSTDGLEHASGESLGVLGQAAMRSGENELSKATPFVEPNPPSAEAASEKGNWFDSLQTISRKMMATPEG